MVSRQQKFAETYQTYMLNIPTKTDSKNDLNRDLYDKNAETCYEHEKNMAFVARIDLTWVDFIGFEQ